MSRETLLRCDAPAYIYLGLRRFFRQGARAPWLHVQFTSVYQSIDYAVVKL